MGRVLSLGQGEEVGFHFAELAMVCDVFAVENGVVGFGLEGWLFGDQTLDGLDGLRSDDRAHALGVGLLVGFADGTLLDVLEHLLVKLVEVVLDHLTRNVLLVLDPCVRKEQLLWMLTYMAELVGNLNYHPLLSSFIKIDECFQPEGKYIHNDESNIIL